MRHVRHLLEEKGSEIHTIEPQESVRAALERMAEHNIGSLLVMQHGELIGLLSERDYARKVILMARSSDRTPVRDIMSAPVMTVTLDASVAECMELCTEEHVRHLPVVADGEVVGLVSIGDLVKSIIADQTEEIEQLQRYITG